MGGMAAGAGLGLIGGLLSNQKEGGTDAGNKMADQNTVNNAQQWQAQGLANIGNASYGQGTTDVQNNGILGGLFGQGGALQRAGNEEQQLASTGYNLTDADKTAYGEASGNIARQFGQNDQSLSQALSDRGLSSSGVAGAAFSNSLGNKNEQLAGLQTQIAQNRMQMNNQRLAQTRQFMGQLGQQAQGAIGQAFGEHLQQGEAQFGANQSLLKGYTDQANDNLQQQQHTQHSSTLSNAFNGAIGGAAGGMGMGGGGDSPKSLR